MTADRCAALAAEFDRNAEAWRILAVNAPTEAQHVTAVAAQETYRAAAEAVRGWAAVFQPAHMPSGMRGQETVPSAVIPPRPTSPPPLPPPSSGEGPA